MLVLLLPFFRSIPAAAKTSTVAPGFTDIKNHWAQSQITRLAALGMVKGYRDRTYKPDQQVSQLEALVLIVQSTGYVPDKPKSVSKLKPGQPVTNTATPTVPWGQPYLDLAIQKGFLLNPGNKGFDYNAQASRLDIAGLLARALLIAPPLNADTFSRDSAEEHANNQSPALKDISTAPAADQPLIKALVDAGIMTGYPDGTFRPYQAVSRSELATIVNRLIDLGWININQKQRQVGWISKVTLSGKTRELELTSLSGKKKYKLPGYVQCYKNGVDYPLEKAYGHSCEIILTGSQVSWINLLEKKDPVANPEKLRASVKSVILGNENLLMVNDLICRDHTLPIAWDAVLTSKKTTSDFKTLKTGTFVDLIISQGQVKEVKVLEVKTLSDTIKEIINGRIYLKSGSKSASKPGWINNMDFARIIDTDNLQLDSVNVDDKVKITYLDPYPEEIDDEIPLEIKVTTKKSKN